MEYLTIILTESALELVPDDLITSFSNKSNKINSPFLDKSFHSNLMQNLDNVDKRGRPDIVHMSTMSITSTPLYLDKKIKLYIHTISDYVFDIEFGVRLPKSYHRFLGLLEKILSNSSNNKSSSLIKLNKSSFTELSNSIQSDYVAALSRRGTQMTSGHINDKIINSKYPTLLIGGFSHGTFSQNILNSVDDLLSISNHKLESHTVCSRMIYEIEKANL